MRGLENMLVVMAVLAGLAGALWVVSHVDQFIQKLRNVRVGTNGSRPDGLLGKIALAVVFVGATAWYVSSGGATIDPDFAYRR